MSGNTSTLIASMLNQPHLSDGQESLYQQFLNSLPVAVYACDNKGFIKHFNEAAIQLFGRTPQAGIDRWCGCYRMYKLDGTPYKLHEYPLAIALATAKPATPEEMIIERPDGTRRTVLPHAQPVFDKDGEIAGGINVVIDVTKQKQAEEQSLRNAGELKQLNDQLERSNHDLEQFAYIASHDLQEPLRKIQTFADLIRNNLHDTHLIERYFGKIMSSAQRMSMLIHDVLNYSRLTKSDGKFVKVNLNKILNDVVNDLELLIEQKKAVITHNELPAIQGNPLQLNQLFSNLINNSIKFSERAPEISVTATFLTTDELDKYPKLQKDTSYVALHFKDNGIGFSQQYAEQIFIIFQRLNNQRAFSGTGIGLALCKKIVEHHDGLIMAQGVKGEGAIFTVILPVK